MCKSTGIKKKTTRNESGRGLYVTIILSVTNDRSSYSTLFVAIMGQETREAMRDNSEIVQSGVIHDVGLAMESRSGVIMEDETWKNWVQ